MWNAYGPCISRIGSVYDVFIRRNAVRDKCFMVACCLVAAAALAGPRAARRGAALPQDYGPATPSLAVPPPQHPVVQRESEHPVQVQQPSS